MSTLSFSTLQFSASREGSSFLARTGHWLATEWRARRAARAVEALSDLSLHDMGIARSEIDSAVRHGRYHQS